MTDRRLRKRSYGASLLLHGAAFAAALAAVPLVLWSRSSHAPARELSVQVASRAAADAPLAETPEEPEDAVEPDHVPVELPPPLDRPDDRALPSPETVGDARPPRSSEPALLDRERILSAVPRNVVLRPTPRPDVEPHMDAAEVTDVAPPEPERPTPATEGPPEATPEPVLVEPQLVASECPQPVYPERWARRGWDGVVVIELDVEADGSVSAARVVESTGHARLDELARSTLARWQLVPATRGGVPVATQHRVRLLFDASSVRDGVGGR